MEKREFLNQLPRLIRIKYPGRRSQVAKIAEGFGIEVLDSWGKERIYAEMLQCPACLVEIYSESLTPQTIERKLEIISPRHSINIRAQHNLSIEKREEFSKVIALERFKNARRFILRAMREGNIPEDKYLLIELKAIQQQFDRVSDIQAIRGLEGAAYGRYRKTLHSMMKYSFRYDGMRSPSPFVAMLQFLESELIELSKQVCWDAGLDPYAGIYHHSSKWGFPGMAYDLIHPYTPKLIDAIVISSINRQKVALKDFESWQGTLSNDVKAKLKDSLEQALQRKIIYRLDWLDDRDKVTYKLALERQASCFASFILDRCEFLPFYLR